MSLISTALAGSKALLGGFARSFGASFGANVTQNSGGILSFLADRFLGLSKKEREANAFTAQQNQAAMDFEERMANQQMQFQADQSATQWQRGVADMRAAGLNPALAYNQGGASAMSGSSGAGHAGASVAPGQSLSDLIQLATLPAQIKLLHAEARRTSAEAAGKEIRNETEGARSQAELDQMVNSALNLAYQRQNLFPAQRALAYAQAELSRAQAGKSSADKTEQEWRNSFIDRFHLSPELAASLASGIASFGEAFIGRLLPIKTLKLPAKVK